MKPYLMSNFPSVRPSLNLQFDSQPTPEDMTSHLASVGATFSRASIGTYTDANGLIQEASAGQARPNYSTAGVHEGLLIEEARTNLIESSEDFSTLFYRQFNNAVITNTRAIAPDGKATAVLIQGASDLNWASGGSQLDYIFNVSSSTEYTLSVYVKSAGATVAGVGLRDQSSGSISKTQNVDISNGEWKRIDVSRTSGSSTPSFAALFGGADGDFYIWGAQAEAGFLTSYIPTSGSTATRSADVCYIDGTAFTDFYNQEEGTWFANLFASGNFGTILDADSPSVDRFPQLGISSATAIQSSFDSFNDYTVDTISSGDELKISVTVTDGAQRNFYNGAFKEETTIANPEDLNILYIGDRDISNAHLNGSIKKLIYFPRALSDNELIKLTQ